MRHWIRNDKGNVLIMMALGFAVLAGFGILTIDIGRMLVTKSQLQNAADAGALAGASMYCNGQPDEASVRAEAAFIGGSNEALQNEAVPVDIDPATDVVITSSTTGHDVTVNTHSDTHQHLLGLFSAFRNTDPTLPNVPSPVSAAAVNATATARCGATCSVTCVKPWSIPDRWDDVTGIPGYMGEQIGKKKRPEWRGDNHWNSEKFTDANGNGLYDVGEAYVDDNGNGRYDQEAYHPSLTGYGPDPVPGNFLSPNGDLGLSLVLKAGSPSAAPEPGQYWPIDLPPVNKGTPVPGGSQYRDNIATCNPASIEKGDWLQTEPGNMVGPTNQGMRDLIAQDPNATWDDNTQSVINSNFAVSPRIVLIPIHDPRHPTSSGRGDLLQVTKVAAFFMERMTGPAEVRGRFLKVRAPGAPCVAGQNSGFFTYALSLIR